METIRIPTRYERSLSRLSDKDRSWILMSLFELAKGNDVKLLDSSAGDILEQVWRDAVMMEKKNKHNLDFIGGDCIASNDAFTTESRRAMKGNEVKGNEVKCIDESSIDGVTTEFSVFWKKYPKKVGKGDAEKSWKKNKPPLEEILKALEWQKESDQWKRESGQYIPNPSTYLNQKRWLDEEQKKVPFNPYL